MNEKQIERPSSDHGKAVVTTELKQDISSSSRKKNREVKCFKCQGYGYITS